MCSSPRNLNRPAADAGDRLGAAAGWLALGGGVVLAAWLGARPAPAPAPGAVRLQPETVLQFALAPMPEVVATPVPDPVPEPEPELEPEVAPEPEPIPEPEPLPAVVSEPAPAPKPLPPPVVEAAPAVAAQPVAEQDGDSGVEEAIRAVWLGELRRRIEQNKYYPGAARFSRETGTVRVRVAIGADGTLGTAEILENTGSPLLARGARGILRRAGAQPLGTNTLRTGFQVEVPITYQIAR